MTVLDRYFELSDRATFDEAAFAELIDLFAERAEVQPSGTTRVRGKAAIEKLYKLFFQTYTKLQRVWATQATEHGLEAHWAIAGRRTNGEVFTMQGQHIARLDPQGKISALEVRVTAS